MTNMTYDEIKEKYEGSEILFVTPNNYRDFSKNRVMLCLEKSNIIEALSPVVITTNYIHFFKYGIRHGQRRKETKIIR